MGEFRRSLAGSSDGAMAGCRYEWSQRESAPMQVTADEMAEGTQSKGDITEGCGMS